MKLLFVSRLFLPHIGGVEKHIFNLSRVLRNHQLGLICEQHDSSLPLHEKVENVLVHRISLNNVSEANKKWVIWKWIHQNQNLLNNSDVIHVHDVFYWLYWYKLLHPTKKIFSTFHGWEGIYPIPISNILQKNLAQLLSSGHLTVGQYISKWYGINPGIITYGATDLPQKFPIKKNQKPQLLYLGRLSEDMGFKACIEKYHRLKKKMNWELNVVGEGPLSHLLPPDAKYLGVVPDPSQAISQSDYVFTTGYLGILEAFAYSKIVLSYYDNPVKKDYLLMHPMAKYITFDDNIPKQTSSIPTLWAKDQSWAKLADQYLQLWKKSQL